MKSLSLQRANALLLLGLLLVTTLYLWRSFLVPLALGILLAMLMLPICQKLEALRVPRVLAILLCILIILLTTAGILAVLSLQITNFITDLPQLQLKLQQQLLHLQDWIEGTFDVSPHQQLSLLRKASAYLLDSTGIILSALAVGTLGGLAEFFLVLLYVFFFLLNRGVFKAFLLRLVEENHRKETQYILQRVSKVSAQYLGGRLLSMLILAILNFAGFLLIGAENPLLLSVIAVLPTVVPYIGPIVGGILPSAITLASSSVHMMWLVIIVLSISQVIQNYFVDPLILGASLNIRPFMTILAIIIGGLIWGAVGMILFAPLLAAAKIIFEHIPALHPYAFLIGGPVSESEGLRKFRTS